MVRRATVADPVGSRWAVVLLLAAVGLPGCHSHFTGEHGTPAKPSPILAITPRFPIEPDVSGLPTETTGFPPGRPVKYRQLTAAECRLYAIQNAPFADDLDRHPDNVSPSHPHIQKRKAEKARVEALVRGHAADESRNRAAAEALDQFYQLAIAEGQFDLLTLAHDELRTQLDAALKAEKQGLRDRAGIDELRVQLLDLEAQMARLEAAIGQLNTSLRARLGLDPKDPLPLWPDDPLRVRPDEVDIEQAVVTGLHYRPDLNLLRVLASESGPGADEVRRQVLGGLNPLLSVATKLATPLTIVVQVWTKGEEKDSAAAREMVASVLAARERQAEAEIRAAVLNLHGQRATAVATAAEVRRHSAKVAELEKRQRAGQQVTAELTKARLDLLKARGDLVKVAADWNIAEVKLRQTMGLLIRE